jgi:hypothetical protein
MEKADSSEFQESEKLFKKKGLLDSRISVERGKLFYLEYSELDEC